MEWKEYILGKVLQNKGYIRGPFGSALKRGDLLSEGIPVYEQQHAIYNKRIFRFYINEEKYKEMHRFTVKPGDIIISCSGTVGEVSLINESDPQGIISQALLLLRVDDSIIIPKYLLYYLKTNEGRHAITSRSSGSVQVNIARREVIEAIPLVLPTKFCQEKIVSILSSLDDKIENNNRINRNLEAQAQALFKSWFVDFEPWGGTMPEDWKEGTLGDICKQLKEKVGERDDVKVLSPVTTGKLMLSEEYFTKQVFSQSIAKYIIVPPTAFAYNPARVNIGSLGMNEFDFDGCVSPVYAVFECLDGYEYYFDLFRQTNMFKEEVKLRAIGGVRQSLNYEDFARITCNIPSKDAVEKFNTIYLANLNVRNHNSKENDRLATLRNTLLPKLMKGEIAL